MLYCWGLECVLPSRVCRIYIGKPHNPHTLEIFTCLSLSRFFFSPTYMYMYMPRVRLTEIEYFLFPILFHIPPPTPQQQRRGGRVWFLHIQRERESFTISMLEKKSNITFIAVQLSIIYIAPGFSIKHFFIFFFTKQN